MSVGALMGRLARIVNVFFGILALCLVVGMAVGGWLFYKHRRADDADAAFKGMAKAQQLLKDLQEGDAGTGNASELEKAEKTLLEARSHYNRGEYSLCLKSVEEAMETLQPLKGELEAPREAARLLAVSGDCALEKGPDGRNRSQASEGAEVAPGDTIVTRGDGACMVSFPSGVTAVLVGPSSMRLGPPGQGGGAGPALSLQEGTLLFHCPSSVSEESAGRVTAEETSIFPRAGSTFQVTCRGPETLLVEAQVGIVAVEADAGRTELKGGLEGKRVVFTRGRPGPEEGLAAPPQVVTPEEGQVFRSKGGGPAQVSVRWEASRARNVRIQIADNPLFARGVVLDRSLVGTAPVATALKAGQYYLRLRSTDDPARSFWSPPQRFRVFEIPSETREPSDWKLEVEGAPIGDSVVLKGRIRPLVTVTVNDVEIHVDRDGRFYGTFPLDPLARKVTVCAFDEKGNQKVWAKSY